MGIQSDSEYVGGGGGDTSTVGDNSIMMGAPISSMSTVSGVEGDDSSIITPTWFKGAAG